jgi:hypothetical protein
MLYSSDSKDLLDFSIRVCSKVSIAHNMWDGSSEMDEGTAVWLCIVTRSKNK